MQRLFFHIEEQTGTNFTKGILNQIRYAFNTSDSVAVQSRKSQQEKNSDSLGQPNSYLTLKNPTN